MNWLRLPSLRMLCAFFACFVIAGDIVADGIHDASGACATESQDSGHDSCPACGCAIHGGSAALSEPAVFRVGNPALLDSVALVDVRFAPGAPLAIDHPPQLS